MNEDCKQLQRQVKELQERVECLQNRENSYLQLQTEISEIRTYLEKVKLFMLRLSQGHFPFNVMVEHLEHKVERKELRKLYVGALNKPPHLSRRALTIIFYLYGMDDKPIMDFLCISRNTVKRYKKNIRMVVLKNFFIHEKSQPKFLMILN